MCRPNVCEMPLKYQNRTLWFVCLSVIGIIFPLNAQAEEIKSLNLMYQSNPSRLKDPVEQQYILHRCTALNTVLSAYWEADYQRFKDDFGLKSKALAEHFAKRADEYLARTWSLSSKTGATVESTNRRINRFVDFYQAETQRNRDLYNETLVGIVKDDIQVCK